MIDTFSCHSSNPVTVVCVTTIVTWVLKIITTGTRFGYIAAYADLECR